MENDASDAKTRSGRRCSVRDASGNNSTYFEITDGLSFGLWSTPYSVRCLWLLVQADLCIEHIYRNHFAVLRPRTTQGSRSKRCCSSEAVAAAVHELQSGDSHTLKE
jgi:hypothetical protein